MRVEFVAAAEREPDEAVSYFEARRPGLGLMFAAEVAAAVVRIEEYPHAWQSLPGGVRRCHLRRFEYGSRRASDDLRRHAPETQADVLAKATI